MGMPKAVRRLGERLDDRVNPIVVKEVRQALRGRQFMVAFWFMVVAATLISIIVILNGAADGRSDDIGPAYFAVNLFCLLIAIQVIVPAWGFTSLGAEWEENTYDLLVLSDLRPHRIVLGKLTSMGIQALLFLAATAPCIAFTFLLGGVDLYVIALTLAFGLVASFFGTCFGLFLSSLSTQRFVRILLLFVLSVVLFFGLMGSQTLCFQLTRDSSLMSDPEFLAGCVGWVTFLIFGGALFLCVCAARLAHPEENRSTPLRILSTVTIVVALGWLTWLQSTAPDNEVVSVMGITLIFAAMIWSTFFATEPQRLGRRVRLQVPENPMLALLCAPFLPGGGRGLMLFFLQLALIAGGIWVVGSLGPPGRTIAYDGGLAALAMVCYAIAYVAIPAGAFARNCETLRGRITVRAFVPFLFLTLLFLPSLLGFFAGSPKLMEMDHPGNPFMVMHDLWDGPGDLSNGLIILLAPMLLFGVLANVRRIDRSLVEIRQVSAERREAARRVVSTEEPLVDAASGS